tara:strand:+ start:162 stop:503 length:342 start_codon:yes stop_codon:yes gene_type:complete
MNFEQSLEYILLNNITSYEIHKATGLSEAGIRKLMRNEVSKPQRKTRDIIIEFVKNIRVINTKDVLFSPEDDRMLRDLASDVIKNHKKLLQTELYSMWFEVECQKRVIEILKE